MKNYDDDEFIDEEYQYTPKKPTLFDKMLEGRSDYFQPPTKRQLVYAWIDALRPPYLIVDLIPILIALALSVKVADGSLLPLSSWPYGRVLLVLIACFLVHTVANISNDLFDYIQGADDGKALGGTGIIQTGMIPPRTITFAIIAFLLIAIIIGIMLMSMTNMWWMSIVIIFAACSAIFYVAPPIEYGYRGYGELMVAINMGFIMTCCSQIIFSGSFNPKSLCFGLIVGLMVAGVLYFQSLPDMDTDRDACKITLAVKLGKERATLLFYAWWPIVWLLMCNIWAAGLSSAWIFLGLLSIPLFLKAAWQLRLAETPEKLRELDKSGHLVRKLYLINGLAIALGAFTA